MNILLSDIELLFLRLSGRARARRRVRVMIKAKCNERSRHGRSTALELEAGP